MELVGNYWRAEFVEKAKPVPLLSEEGTSYNLLRGCSSTARAECGVGSATCGGHETSARSSPRKRRAVFQAPQRSHADITAFRWKMFAFTSSCARGGGRG